MIDFAKFLSVWLPSLAVSAAVPPPVPQLGDLFVIDLGGVPVPLATAAIGAAGVLLARPFARRSEAELGWPLRLAVTAIMLILVQLWIVESRPGWLYAFVVAVGLGFTGYSLLELFGEQVKDFTRGVFDKARATIGQRPASKDDDDVR